LYSSESGRGLREIKKKACCQGSLTPVSERELCCCEHCKHSTLDGAEHLFHLPILPVFVAWNNVVLDPHFFQSADEFMTLQFSCSIHLKTDDFLSSLSFPTRFHKLKCLSRLILLSQTMDLQDVCQVFKEGNEIQFPMRSEDWKRSAEVAEDKLKEFGGLWSGGRGMGRASVFPDYAQFTLL